MRGMLIDLFRAATPENPSFNLSDPDAWDALLAGSESKTGVRINRDSALSYSPWWRAVNLIATDVAKLPCHIYRREGTGKERATDHPSYFLVRRKPNAFQTAFQFRRQLTGHAISTGNGYAYIFREGDASIREMLPLDPDRTVPVREDGRLLYITELDGNQFKLLPENVLHVKGFSFDGLVGYNVIDKAKEDLGLGIGGRRYAAIYFKNSARAPVVLETPNKVSEETIKNLRSSWERMHQGLENAHRTAVLQQGMTAKIMSFSAADSQLIESRQFTVKDVANFTGVPPHKLGDDAKVSYKSLEQENQSYLIEALDSWLCTWEEEQWDKCLMEKEKRGDSHIIEFLRAAIVRADLVTRGNYYRLALGGAPWMLRNEVRSAENLNPVEGWDEPMDPLNMQNPGGNPDFTDNPPADEEQQP